MASTIRYRHCADLQARPQREGLLLLLRRPEGPEASFLLRRTNLLKLSPGISD